MSLTKSEKWYPAAADKGCAFTGKRLPHLPYNGVEYAHIISREYSGSTAHEPNGFPLSPDQHAVLDKLIKKKLLKAYFWSLSRQDFKRLPKQKKKEDLKPEDCLCQDGDEFLSKLFSSADLYDALHELSSDKDFSAILKEAAGRKDWIKQGMAEQKRRKEEDEEIA